MRHTISIRVENRFGELSRIVGLFTARGCNIESLTVAQTFDPEVSQATVITNGTEQVVGQIVKRLARQVRVLKVSDLKNHARVEREILLVRVKAEIPLVLAEVLRLACANQARLIEASEGSLTLEASGDCETVGDLVASFGQLGVSEVVRGGAVALGVLSRPEAAETVPPDELRTDRDGPESEKSS